MECFSKIMGELGLRTYELGVNDCLTLIREYINKKYGATLPESFRGVTLADYKDLYIKDKEKAFKIFKEYIEASFESILKRFFLSGDILWTYAKGEADNKIDLLTVGISAGNGLMLTTSSKTGNIFVSLSGYDIEKVYRWVEE